MDKNFITIEVTINASIEKVWNYWTLPEHIINWNFASPDWHTTTAKNNLEIGGTFSYRMEAKDGSFGFDFGGIYTEIIPLKEIKYTMADGRVASINFIENANNIKIIETFEAETENTLELQQYGWQFILNNFKQYTEASR